MTVLRRCGIRLAASCAFGIASGTACWDGITAAQQPLVLLWRYPSESSCRSRGPASDGQRVFVPFSDGAVRAFTLRSGSLLWETSLGSPYFDDIKVLGGRVLVQVGTAVVSLDPARGTVLWSAFDTSDALRGTLSFDAAASVVLAGGQSRFLRALNLADGSVAWQLDLAEAALSTLVVDRTVYAGTIDASAGPANQVGRIIALDLDTRARRWTFLAPKLEVGSGFVAPLTFGDGVVLGDAANGRAYAVDASSGLERWHFDAATFLGGPATDGRLVFVPSNDGHLYTLSSATGALVWSRFFGGASLYTEPTLYADSGLLVKAGADLYALDRADGRVRWTYHVRDANICAPPLAVGATIVLAAEDGVYALEEAR